MSCLWVRHVSPTAIVGILHRRHWAISVNGGDWRTAQHVGHPRPLQNCASVTLACVSRPPSLKHRTIKARVLRSVQGVILRTMLKMVSRRALVVLRTIIGIVPSPNHAIGSSVRHGGIFTGASVTFPWPHEVAAGNRSLLFPMVPSQCDPRTGCRKLTRLLAEYKIIPRYFCSTSTLQRAESTWHVQADAKHSLKHSLGPSLPELGPQL